MTLAKQLLLKMPWMGLISMEKLPEWAKSAGAAIALLFLPSVGFIYSQGADSKTSEQLANSNIMLTQSVQQLTTEITNLSMKLNTQMVKVDYSEKRINKLEQIVESNTNQIATLISKEK